jgi:hypothetical protein
VVDKWLGLETDLYEAGPALGATDAAEVDEPVGVDATEDEGVEGVVGDPERLGDLRWPHVLSGHPLSRSDAVGVMVPGVAA